MRHETAKAIIEARRLMEEVDQQTAKFVIRNYQDHLVTQLSKDIQKQANKQSFRIFSDAVDSCGGSLQDILNASRKQGIDAKSIDLINQAISQYKKKKRSLQPSLASKLPYELRLQLLELYFTIIHIAITIAVWGAILTAAYLVLVKDVFDLL